MANAKICSLDGCDLPKKTAGLCNKHYQRKWKHGDPLKRKSNANGEGGITSQGYVSITVNGERILEHVHVCEKALGKKMPFGSEVHHFNEVKTDNRNENLVICQSAKYHQLLHARQLAMDSCGNPDWRRCRYCKQWDDPSNMYTAPGALTGYHRKCRQKTRSKNG